MIQKPAPNDHPIHEPLAQRWSPRAFDARPIEPATLASLFEAARWSASTFNGQPWRFIVATQDHANEFKKMVACLNASNQRWAPNAPVLMMTAAKTTFDADGSAHWLHLYDLGLAVQNLIVQATSMGLMARQMAGILPDVVRETYHVPDDYVIATGIALGYQGTLDDLDERYHEREQAPRSRKPLSELVFRGDWDQPADLGG